MAKKNDFFRKTFGSGGSDIIGLKDIEHIRAKNSKSAGDSSEPKNECGKNQMVGDVEKLRGGREEVVVQGGQAADGKPTCSGGHPDSKQGKKELGNSQGEVGGGGGEAIDPSARAGGGKHGERDRESPGK